MGVETIGSGSSVAMYWDFENLHAGVLEAKHGEGLYAKPDNRFKPQEPLVDVQALVELAASFGPVARKIKAAGRTLIGIGTRKNTNKHWAKSCHEFRYYESLVEVAEAPAAQGPEEAPPAAAEVQANPAVDLLRRAVHLLAESRGEPWVKKASVLPMIKRLDPTFDPKDYQYASFGELLKSLDAVIEVRKGDSDHELRLR